LENFCSLPFRFFFSERNFCNIHRTWSATRVTTVHAYFTAHFPFAVSLQFERFILVAAEQDVAGSQGARQWFSCPQEGAEARYWPYMLLNNA
jgi:hypothetical protein